MLSHNQPPAQLSTPEISFGGRYIVDLDELRTNNLSMERDRVIGNINRASEQSGEPICAECVAGSPNKGLLPCLIDNW